MINWHEYPKEKPENTGEYVIICCCYMGNIKSVAEWMTKEDKYKLAEEDIKVADHIEFGKDGFCCIWDGTWFSIDSIVSGWMEIPKYELKE